MAAKSSKSKSTTGTGTNRKSKAKEGVPAQGNGRLIVPPTKPVLASFNQGDYGGLPWNLRGQRLNPFGAGISYSALNLFRRCPEQARLSYLCGWKPVWDTYPIEWGEAFHACNSFRINDGLEVGEATEKYIEGWKKERPEATVEALTEFGEMMEEVGIILSAYEDHWKDKDSKITWIARENWFHINYELPSIAPLNQLFNPTPVDGLILPPIRVPIHGIWDGVFSKSRPELRYVLETKTVDRISETNVTSKLVNDLQTMMYLTSVRQIFGKMPIGVWYDLVRRPSISQKKTESRNDFLARLIADVRSDPEKYFTRYEVSLLASDLERWQRQVFNPLLFRFVQWLYYSFRFDPDTETFKLLDDPYDNPYHYLNDGELVSMFGLSRYYSAITQNDFSALIQRTPRVPVPITTES